jgi:ribosomal protein S18 acetylase RimI-like enzyme
MQNVIASPLIREYDHESDAPGLRACIIELQEFERRIDPSLPPGAVMAQAYASYILDRCQACAGKVYVVEANRQVVGFVCIWATVMPSEPDEPQSSYAYVSDLVVLPRFRRQGLGRALLLRAENYAREQGVSVIRIGVLAGNSMARALYSSAGFVDRRIELSKSLRSGTEAADHASGSQSRLRK